VTRRARLPGRVVARHHAIFCALQPPLYCHLLAAIALVKLPPLLSTCLCIQYGAIDLVAACRTGDGRGGRAGTDYASIKLPFRSSSAYAVGGATVDYCSIASNSQLYVGMVVRLHGYSLKPGARYDLAYIRT